MKKYITAIVGAIVMAVTAAVFLLLTKAWYQLPMCWLSLSVILTLELAATVLLSLSGGSPRKVAGGLVVAAGAALIILISAFYLAIFPLGLTGYIVIVLLLFAVCAVFTVIAWHHDSGAEQKRAAKTAIKEQFRSCRSTVVAMRHSPAGQPHARLLQELEEELRYLNDTVSSPMDGQIAAAIGDMSRDLEQEGYDLPAAAHRVLDLVKQRNYSVRG